MTELLDCFLQKRPPPRSTLFPTRRSSDLFSGPWTFATPSLPDDFKKIPVAHPRSRVLASVPGIFLKSDRKSTRLNSSHEWISYAVFCLKKKTRNQGRGFARQRSMALHVRR